ncbi:hypothetical protein J18TS1_17480 [Oceanobacillus oncorhynchi subsp. incaldanensis]|nr:hypothetical protein [Oceanobacillus oncorhynchi]GIO18648.1 hypothetical protein J18TS1_17480 [Oceanobacillus oncorhynchi subsp. incaldanensis]
MTTAYQPDALSIDGLLKEAPDSANVAVSWLFSLGVLFSGASELKSNNMK